MTTINLSFTAPTWAWYVVVGLLCISNALRVWLVILSRKNNQIARMRAARGM